MSLLLFKNFSKGTLSSTLTSAATVVDLTTNHGSRFPNAPFVACIFNSTDYSDAADAFWGGAAELILVTSNPTASQFPVVTRAYDGTTALNFTDTDKTYTVFHVANADFHTRTVRKDKDTGDIDVKPNGTNGIQIDSTGETAIGIPPPTPVSGLGLTIGSGFQIDSGRFQTGEGAQLTISGSPDGVIVPTHPFHEVNNDGGSRTIERINGLLQSGNHLFLHPSTGNNLIFDETFTGGGQIRFGGGTTITLSNAAQYIHFIYDGASWRPQHFENYVVA